jgi:NADPH:quinone reductase-like Zn-dependent oxidoreductase
MNRAIAQHSLKPIIEQTFALEKARDAFELMERGGHFGKIGLTL